MPYPDTTRDPYTHFDLVLKSIDADMKESKQELEHSGVEMVYEVIYDTKDRSESWDGMRFTGFAWVKYHLKDMGDVFNEIAEDFWLGMTEKGAEFIDIDPDIDEEIDNTLLVGSKFISITANYTSDSSSEENDFEIFLEVCEEDSEMYSVIEDVVSNLYDVEVECEDYGLDAYIDGDIREVFKMVTELVESGDIDSEDVEDFAYDYGEDIYLAYFRRKFTDKEYILNMYKEWESQ